MRIESATYPAIKEEIFNEIRRLIQTEIMRSPIFGFQIGFGSFLGESGCRGGRGARYSAILEMPYRSALVTFNLTTELGMAHMDLLWITEDMRIVVRENLYAARF